VYWPQYEAYIIQFRPEFGLTVLSAMREKVEKVLEELRPNLQADGGNIQLVDVQEGVVKVKLTGACAGCPMSRMTLQWGVEQFLKKKVPEVQKVESVE